MLSTNFYSRASRVPQGALDAQSARLHVSLGVGDLLNELVGDFIRRRDLGQFSAIVENPFPHSSLFPCERKARTNGCCHGLKITS